MDTLKTLNKRLMELGMSDNTEVTKHKGKYHLLHICDNGVPVLTFITGDIHEIRGEIELRFTPTTKQ